MALMVSGDRVKAADTTADVGAFAKIAMPEGATLEPDEAIHPDFAVYYLKRQERILLGIYIGNAPDVATETLGSAIMIAGCDARITTAGGTANNMDALLAVRSRIGFPRFIHFWFRGLPDRQAKQSVGLLSTGFTLSPNLDCG
jgi:hypothetical protein